MFESILSFTGLQNNKKKKIVAQQNDSRLSPTRRVQINTIILFLKYDHENKNMCIKIDIVEALSNKPYLLLSKNIFTMNARREGMKNTWIQYKLLVLSFYSFFFCCTF